MFNEPPGCSDAPRTSGSSFRGAASLLLPRQDQAQKRPPALSELSLLQPQPRGVTPKEALPHLRDGEMLPAWYWPDKEHSGEAGSKGHGPIPAGPRPCLCFADGGGLHSLPKCPRGNPLEPPEPILAPRWKALTQGVGVPRSPPCQESNQLETRFTGQRLQSTFEPTASEPHISASLPRSCSWLSVPTPIL